MRAFLLVMKANEEGKAYRLVVYAKHQYSLWTSAISDNNKVCKCLLGYKRLDA